MSNIDEQIKREATGVLTYVLLFLLYYLGLIVLGLCMFIVAGWITVQIPNILTRVEHVNLRGVFIAVLAFLSMWWFCIEIGRYLIRPLLGITVPVVNNDKEVNYENCPELFSLIEEVASKTGNMMPLHVYITPEVNACVSYNSVSLWSVFFPPRKNLSIGTGLFYGMNRSELKAILSHEFGHFSQETMRIGTLIYRLLIVTRNIYLFTLERQKNEAVAKASSDYKWYFHLASVPIYYITKLTIAFYRHIEKKNRRLSRYMEFEADNVACKIVGADAYVSALYKLDLLSQRNNIYENSLALLLSEGHHFEESFEGYIYLYGLLEEDESLRVGCQDILSSPVRDESTFTSRVKILDGWNTHPTLSERIENAKTQGIREMCIDTNDAYELIPKVILNSVGESRQKDIAVGMEKPVDWDTTTPMSLKDFKTWLMEEIMKNLPPHFMRPYLNKTIVSVKLPTVDELENEEISTPFTKENRDLLLEYEQACRDWETLVEIHQNKNSIHFTYNGEKIDISLAIEQHQSYLESFHSRLEDIDVKIYKYLWKLADDKQHFYAMYWLMFYSNDGLHALQQLHQVAYEIKNTMKYYVGNVVQIKDEIRIDLSKRFRDIMASFDFKAVSSLCGEWSVEEGKTVNQLLYEWQDYLSEDSTPYDGTVTRIEEVWSLLSQMFNVSNGDWQKFLVYAYNKKGIDDN